MYRLEKLNVVRIVATEVERDKLINLGFEEVPEEVTEEVLADLDFNDLTVEQLKELAKEKGIEGISKMKKEELIETLKGGE